MRWATPATEVSEECKCGGTFRTTTPTHAAAMDALKDWRTGHRCDDPKPTVPTGFTRREP